MNLTKEEADQLVALITGLIAHERSAIGSNFNTPAELSLFLQGKHKCNFYRHSVTCTYCSAPNPKSGGDKK